MANILMQAGKSVRDIKTFIKDSADAPSMKYKAEANKKHLLYFPAIQNTVMAEDGIEVTERGLNARMINIHEWRTVDGRFASAACLKGYQEVDDKGNTLYDGTCPFCDRVGDAWDIYKYVFSKEQEECTLEGQAREEYLAKVKSKCLDNRKARKETPYMYVLTALFTFDNIGNPVVGEDGTPKYDLKVLKMTAKRAEKIEKQLENYQGATLAGSTLIYDYPQIEDARALVSQATLTVLTPEASLVSRYPGLAEKVEAEAADYNWDGIEESFPELATISLAQAKRTVESLFDSWDKYKKELEVNPNAKYLGYESSNGANKPNLLGGVTPAPTANVNVQGVFSNQPTLGAPVQAPEMDPNQVFANALGGAAGTGPNNVIGM